MKAKFIQKMMAGALAMALVVTPAMSVHATPAAGGAGSGGSSSASSEKKVVEIVNESLAESDGEGGGSSVSSVSSIPVSSSVAGIKTTVKGVYLATSVNGTAIRTGLSTIVANYGLGAGEVPSARIYNLDVKKSPLAAAALNQAAESVGAVVGPYVNVEIGKVKGGKFSLLPSDGAEISVSFGIPASFAQAGKTFAVACVRPGGAVYILQDIDNNPNTVTFNTTGGQGAYAIIKY